MIIISGFAVKLVSYKVGRCERELEWVGLAWVRSNLYGLSWVGSRNLSVGLGEENPCTNVQVWLRQACAGSFARRHSEQSPTVSGRLKLVSEPLALREGRTRLPRESRVILSGAYVKADDFCQMFCRSTCAFAVNGGLRLTMRLSFTVGRPASELQRPTRCLLS